MQRLPLIGGSYSARSELANCQRCWNLFPENNRADSPTPVTHYQRPGLSPLATPAAPAVGRGVYQASNEDCYTVIGGNLYYVAPNWTLTLITALTAGVVTPVSMIDNGIEMLVVDGVPAVGGIGGGWRVNLSTRAATVMNDPSWTGADRVDYLDTFIVWNQPNTALFGSTLSNQIVPLDPTYTAGKTGYPDKLQTLAVNRHELLLLGWAKGEIWYDAGGVLFPFGELPGAYIEHGIGAKYSIATADISTFWLGRDLQSGRQGVVFEQKGYQTTRISNHALEHQIAQMALGGTVADAVGFTYQQEGHVFYVLSFPTGNQTWVYDATVQDPMLAWSQRGWMDGEGVFNRDRGAFGASFYGMNVVQDWANGTIYKLDLGAYSDTVGGVVYPITYLRTFPHLMSGIDDRSGQPVLANGKPVKHTRFLLDVTAGTGPPAAANGDLPQFSLRWSDDRGKTWGNAVLQQAGTLGQYETRPEWAGALGMAMDRVYEVSWNFPGEVAIQGAWVDGVILTR